jgi:hypothetical protein
LSVLPDFAMRPVRLVYPVPDANGLSVDAEGLYLGACALIAKRAGRFVPRGPAALDYLLTLAYGGANDAAAFHGALWPIARKLDDGDLTGAMIRALLLELPDLPDEASCLRLESANDLFKLGFDPDQPRDAQGRWSDAGSSAALLRQAFEAARQHPLPNGVQVADADGHIPAALIAGSKGHQFRFVLNNEYESALECTDCGTGGKSFPAFSGLRSTGAVDDAAQTALADEGAIPIGRYLIVDRAKGRLEQVWSQVLPYHDGWFALIPAPMEAAVPGQGWNDTLSVGGVTRGGFRLHPEGPLGRSEGCITITGRTEDKLSGFGGDPELLIWPNEIGPEPKGKTIGENYRDLHDLLTSTPAEYLPETTRRVYGIVNVVGAADGDGK